jgi:bifunctional non-homologous end joining protein LigD
MLWDRGTYEPEKGEGEDGVREGYKKGDLKVVFHGKRMKGSWVLVRTRGWGGGGGADKPSWLLIKHRDKYVEPGDALIERYTTSVVTKRTMEQIGGSAKSRVWHSNRPAEDDGDVGGPRKRTVSIAEARAARAKARAASTPEE